MKKTNWLITQQQIQGCDVESAILTVDPEQIPDAAISGLHGAVRLRFEAATGPADIFAKTESRKFVRAMHKRWPFAAYFLRLKPVTCGSSVDQIMDLSVFMSLALCHVDELSCCQTARGVCLKYDVSQLWKHMAELTCRAMELGEVIGLSKEEIQKRDDLITKSVVSFFEAGETFAPQIKHRNRRKNQ